MLGLEVSARPDGTLEARGILGENLQVGSENGRAVCDPELALSCIANRAPVLGADLEVFAQDPT